MRVSALVLAFAGFAASGCASTAGQPWKNVQVGMTDEAALALGGRPSSVAKGDEGAVVLNYPDGGSLTFARDAEGEWRVASFQRP